MAFGKRKKNLVYLTVRVHPELRKSLQRQAKRDGRSVSNYVRHLLERASSIGEEPETVPVLPAA